MKQSFLADAMLGKLSKWLRALGWDTSYIKNKPATELLQTAETEGRTLKTLMPTSLAFRKLT